MIQCLRRARRPVNDLFDATAREPLEPHKQAGVREHRRLCIHGN